MPNTGWKIAATAVALVGVADFAVHTQRTWKLRAALEQDTRLPHPLEVSGYYIGSFFLSPWPEVKVHINEDVALNMKGSAIRHFTWETRERELIATSPDDADPSINATGFHRWGGYYMETRRSDALSPLPTVQRMKEAAPLNNPEQFGISVRHTYDVARFGTFSPTESCRGIFINVGCVFPEVNDTGTFPNGRELSDLEQYAARKFTRDYGSRSGGYISGMYFGEDYILNDPRIWSSRINAGIIADHVNAVRETTPGVAAIALNLATGAVNAIRDLVPSLPQSAAPKTAPAGTQP